MPNLLSKCVSFAKQVCLISYTGLPCFWACLCHWLNEFASFSKFVIFIREAELSHLLSKFVSFAMLGFHVCSANLSYSVSQFHL